MTSFPGSTLHTGMPARVIYALFAIACLANGLWLLVDPTSWNSVLRMQLEDFGDGYNVPLYMLRKTGVTYLCISLAFAWCLFSPSVRARVHPVLTLFFVLIAGVHAAEIAGTGAPAHRWVTDFPLVFLPPVLLLLMLVPLPDFSQRERGKVKWFDTKKGFGFIVRDNGEEIFVHYRSIRGRGHRALKDGQPVRFRVATGDKGLQAEDVSPG